MRAVRSVRPTLTFCLLAAVFTAGCSDSGTPQATTTPGTSTPTVAQVADAPTPADQQPATGEALQVRFVLGTSYAAAGVRAEIALQAKDQRVVDVLQAIADAGDVPLEISPDTGLDLDRTVTMNFDNASLATIFMLLTDGSNVAVDAEDNAIRVRPKDAPAA